MSDYTSLQKALIKKALLFSLIAACCFLALNLKSAARGVALGALFSVVDFRLMALLVGRHLAQHGRITRYVGLSFRFILLSIPLAFAINLPSLNLAATVAGLLSVKAAIFYHFFVGKHPAASVGLNTKTTSVQGDFNKLGCKSSTSSVQQERS